jgi:hypothetical protein
MRGGASLSLALLVATLGLGATANAATGLTTDAAATQLEACAQRLDAARDVGVARIMARCPELARAWQRDAAAYGLPRNWRDVGGEVSADSLRELARLLRATQAAPPRGTATAPSLRAATLEGVLADWPPFEDAGLIARVLRWVLARVGADPTLTEPQTSRNSAEQRRFSTWLAKALPWVALVATLALLAWVVQRERSAAAGAARASRGVSPRPSPAVAATSDVSGVPVSPGDWLGTLAARLAARGLLRYPAGATSREILAAAPTDTRLAPQWTLLATVADEMCYAPQPPDPARCGAALAAGRALAEALR